jgi:hypothetical protein
MKNKRTAYTQSWDSMLAALKYALPFALEYIEIFDDDETDGDAHYLFAGSRRSAELMRDAIREAEMATQEPLKKNTIGKIPR